jgi:hypothetical protein
MLPGKLSQSKHSTDYFRKHFDAITDKPFTTLIRRLFALKLSPEYDTWNETDWLCEGCLKTFISENLHLWLLDCRQQGETV